MKETLRQKELRQKLTIKIAGFPLNYRQVNEMVDAVMGVLIAEDVITEPLPSATIRKPGEKEIL